MKNDSTVYRLPMFTQLTAPSNYPTVYFKSTNYKFIKIGKEIYL